MNWGYSIILVFIVFAAGILTLVVKSMRTRLDMASPDYYAEELKYQQNIDAQVNYHRLSASVNITQTQDAVEIAFPRECIGAALEGEVIFYRPSDSRKDFTLPLQLDGQGKLLVAREKFDRGNYRIKLRWTSGDTPYFQEKQFFVQ